MAPEDHTSTDSPGKTNFPLRRGTAARSEGEAPQGDVAGVNQDVGEEPHQHPPPSLALGHPLRRGNSLALRPSLIIQKGLDQ